MIPKEQLKSGNKVLFEGTILTVNEVKEHDVTFIETDAAVEYPDLDPIPLTEPILLALGFIPKENYLFHPELSLRWEYDSLWQEIGPDHLNNLGMPKYLHQLQNSIRNFFGKELVVNLEKVRA